NTFFNFSWEGNGRYRYTSENFQPESLSDEIEIFVDQIDLARRYDQFDDWAEGWIWDRYLLYKNETDIRHLTRNQVRLFINYFYAHHGYEFKNPFYRDYFIRYGYKINPNFSVNDFNEYEQKNIAFLLKMESMIP
ncbi:MAG: YARHG domain-containing protein, partial [Treponema sp.]|nr:YARHG domain-containing protein [Treponema sp.]